MIFSISNDYGGRCSYHHEFETEDTSHKNLKRIVADWLQEHFKRYHQYSNGRHYLWYDYMSVIQNGYAKQVSEFQLDRSTSFSVQYSSTDYNRQGGRTKWEGHYRLNPWPARRTLYWVYTANQKKPRLVEAPDFYGFDYEAHIRETTGLQRFRVERIRNRLYAHGKLLAPGSKAYIRYRGMDRTNPLWKHFLERIVIVDYNDAQFWWKLDKEGCDEIYKSYQFDVNNLVREDAFDHSALKRHCVQCRHDGWLHSLDHIPGYEGFMAHRNCVASLPNYESWMDPPWGNNEGQYVKGFS